MATYDLELLKKELMRDEGKKLHAYKDSLGFWTIGIGHLLGKIKTKSVITEEECDSLFREDLVKAELNLQKVFPEWRDLDSVRQRVLMNMSFNLGGNLKKFVNFLAALRSENWEKACFEMRNSHWYDQVGKRAERLCVLMKTGDMT